MLDWFTPFDQVSAGTFKDGNIAWFLNGKINACYNAVDRQLPARADQTAILWEGDEPTDIRRITFQELQDKVCKIANSMKMMGVKKGDTVTTYMPMVPELAMTMLACARIGAVHSVIFAGFSASALAERIIAAESKWIFTCDGGYRGGRHLPLKTIVDSAVAMGAENIVEKVFVWKRVGDKMEVPWVDGRDVKFDEVVATQRPYCPCEWMDSEDPLFILYTSGR